MKILIIFFQLI